MQQECNPNGEVMGRGRLAAPIAAAPLSWEACSHALSGWPARGMAQLVPAQRPERLRFCESTHVSWSGELPFEPSGGAWYVMRTWLLTFTLLHSTCGRGAQPLEGRFHAATASLFVAKPHRLPKR